MKKSITVTTQNPHVLEQSSSIMSISAPKAVITSTEGWQITAACRNEEKTEDLEQTQIKIYLPKSKVLTCTIQDLAALPAILGNAVAHMMKYSEGDFNGDKLKEGRVLDSTMELQALLKLFK